MSAIEPTSSEEIEIVDRTQLDHREAATLLVKALEHANHVLSKEGKAFEVIYHGQPHLQKAIESIPATLDPNYPVDLALLHENKRIEPIDIVDLVTFIGYQSDSGRLTSGFKTLDSFVYEITQKVHHHLAATQLPHYLISAAGSK